MRGACGGATSGMGFGGGGCGSRRRRWRFPWGGFGEAFHGGGIAGGFHVAASPADSPWWGMAGRFQMAVVSTEVDFVVGEFHRP